jgi:hypothetical protein
MYEGLSRCERLDRWAAVLERAEITTIVPFRDVEFFAPATRDDLRTANSALDLAHRDPVLRRAGLPSDRFGDGAEFFGLSTKQAHRLLCSCGYFGPVRGTEVARRIRALAARQRLREWMGGMLPAAARWLAGRALPVAMSRG